jgi:hypothetical protein
VLPTVDADRFAIRQLVENWALWRDAGDWERFATVWHPTEGWMTATWFQGPARDFIAASRQGFDAGVSILHFLGGHTADVAAERAIAQTKMTINQRAEIDGVAVDATTTGSTAMTPNTPPPQRRVPGELLHPFCTAPGSGLHAVRLRWSHTAIRRRRAIPPIHDRPARTGGCRQRQARAAGIG